MRPGNAPPAPGSPPLTPGSVGARDDDELADAYLEGQRRGLRIELVPAHAPKIVLEPWNKEIVLHDTPYPGSRKETIRTWGRDRLRVLGRLPNPKLQDEQFREMRELLKLVPASQVTYGTDFPYFPLDQIAGLRKLGLAPAQVRAIESGNAIRLVPQVKV